jgi:hypothetical protein
MSKFEWVELETLSTEVAHVQSRINAARANKNYGMVRLLEREMAEVSERRNRVLANITNGISDAPPDGQQPTHFSTQEIHSNQPDEKQQPTPETKAPTLSSLTAPDPALPTDPAGDTSMWDKLTAADLDRVKRGLTTRRSEMLARHAEELKTLEAEQTEIDKVERAIAAFAQKFKLTPSAEVVPLQGERVPAQAG